MRETDKLANDKFDGNVKLAIEYMMRNYDDDVLSDKIENEWTHEEVQYSLSIVMKMAIERKGKKNVDLVLNNAEDLISLKLTREEVLNAEKNPFKANLLKDFLKLLVVNGGLVAFIAASNNLGLDVGSNVINAIQMCASVFTTYISLDAGPNLLKYFKFKKLKKNLKKEEELVKFSLNEEGVGKKL